VINLELSSPKEGNEFGGVFPAAQTFHNVFEALDSDGSVGERLSADFAKNSRNSPKRAMSSVALFRKPQTFHNVFEDLDSNGSVDERLSADFAKLNPV
jgi:hypothetical protein